MSKITGEWIADILVRDTATGNGSTTIFNLSGKLHSSDSLQVYVNGLLRTLTTDYTVNVSTSQVTFTTAPAIAQNIEFRYIEKSL